MASYLTKGADPIYLSQAMDIRVNIPSGVLTLGDGTAGGAPISGIDYGIPTDGIIQWRPVSGCQGDSLQGLMNQFPQYTRIRHDESSLGAQMMVGASCLIDELVDEQTRFLNARYLPTYPVFEQGVVYEWNYAEADDLDQKPAVSGRLGTSWFTVPLVEREIDFWLSPPTRLETTSSEIQQFDVLPVTQIAASGLVSLLTDVTPPIFNRIYLNVSGFVNFRTDIDPDRQVFGKVIIRGTWANDDLRNPISRIEEIPIQANGIVPTQHAWRHIKSIETRGLEPSGYVGASMFNFRPLWRVAPLGQFYPENRNQVRRATYWQNIRYDAHFHELVQPEEMRTPAPSGEAWLAKTRILTDTIYDNDVEFDVLDVWRVTQPDGSLLSGIIDIAPVPSTRYMLLLDRVSNAWVVDTWVPALNMAGFSETQQPPLRIQGSWPQDVCESPSNFTVSLETTIVDSSRGVNRWRWIEHYSGTQWTFDSDGSKYPLHHLSGWQSGPGITTKRDALSVSISGAGQHTFELEMVSDDAAHFRTYWALMMVEKQALGGLPIRGLSVNPEAIDFDWHGRPWVQVSGNAVRLAMRTDLGMWLPEEKVLLTREPYDEVRKQ